MMRLPALGEWNVYGGFTPFGGPFSYSIEKDGVQWGIDPVFTSRNRAIGYHLWAFGLPGRSGYTFIDSDGEENFIVRRIHHRADSAAKVARKVHEKYYGGK